MEKSLRFEGFSFLVSQMKGLDDDSGEFAGGLYIGVVIVFVRFSTGLGAREILTKETC